MNIEPLVHSINRQIMKFSVSSSERALCTYLLSKYISTGSSVKGKLLKRVTVSCALPMELFSQTEKFSVRSRYKKGWGWVVDPMQIFLFHDNFTTSEE